VTVGGLRTTDYLRPRSERSFVEVSRFDHRTKVQWRASQLLSVRTSRPGSSVIPQADGPWLSIEEPITGSKGFFRLVSPQATAKVFGDFSLIHMGNVTYLVRA
jgi:hypothetical protein